MNEQMKDEGLMQDELENTDQTVETVEKYEEPKETPQIKDTKDENRTEITYKGKTFKSSKELEAYIDEEIKIAKLPEDEKEALQKQKEQEEQMAYYKKLEQEFAEMSIKSCAKDKGLEDVIKYLNVSDCIHGKDVDTNILNERLDALNAIIEKRASKLASELISARIQQKTPTHSKQNFNERVNAKEDKLQSFRDAFANIFDD